MTTGPMRIILCGYGVTAAAVTVAAAVTPLSTTAAVVMVWLGGAVVTLALAAAPRTRKLFGARRLAVPGDAAAQASLRRWNADLQADAVSGAADGRAAPPSNAAVEHRPVAGP